MSFRISACLLLLLASCKPDSGRSRNRLGEETSPYLLQHAQNPVHWQPWEETIWDRAREENKLVLISIGYASCHWCHVMEEETFENDSVARFMNERFISVKVDREERPDVDQVYMTAVQLMTGSGGWPLNVVALPNGKPVYGGTYHTREQWLQVLAEVHKRFLEDPARLSDYADRVAQGVAEVNLLPEAGNDADLREGVLDAAVSGWQTRWDTRWGGNAETQKFMLPPNLDFLLGYQHLSGNDAARAHLEHTLDRMAGGGVFDQVGGGFFRYSTDPRWHIPHFEKMLYDNAQLLGVYARAHKQWPKASYRQVVERIFGFLRRDMKAPGGGYFAALDADTEGEEGKYYVWKAEELQRWLGQEYEAFAAYYGITPERAWEGDRYIPFREVADDAFARDRGISLRDLEQQKRSWHKKLMEARAQRTFPGKDDKIITSWNALLISGLADAYDAFGEEAYLREAEEVFAFLLGHAVEDGQIRHSYKPGDARSLGFLEDYAFMARAAFRLYQVTAKIPYLELTRDWLADIEQKFADADSPLFRFRAEEGLIAPILKTDDGVMPSPNTVVAGLYLDLGHFFYRPEWLQKGKEMVLALQDRFVQLPENYAGWGQLMLRFRYPFHEVAVSGPGAGRLRAEMAREPLPNSLLVWASSPSELPLFDGRYDPGQTRIFVCQNHSCRLPVVTAGEALAQIRQGPSLFP